jgi:hypothetical protein
MEAKRNRTIDSNMIASTKGKRAFDLSLLMTTDSARSGVEWVCLKVVARHAGQTSSWLNPDAQSLLVNATWNVMIIHFVHLVITQYYRASMKRPRVG